MTSAAKSIWGWYSNCIRMAPVRTKCITSGVIMALGDYTAQRLESDREWDYIRTAKWSSVGIFVISPQIQLWLKFLDKYIPGTTNGRVVAKMIVDQTFFAPYLLCCNFASVNFLSNNGHLDVDALKNKISNDLINTMKVGVMIWPLANFISFNALSSNGLPPWLHPMAVDEIGRRSAIQLLLLNVVIGCGYGNGVQNELQLPKLLTPV
ncbi:hypothetical protein SAMD00019534_104230 [Acytostelium subglobosum LB1]|uniref:hypothetical protein n=1 Tax=Acytostelium subglobosum LB1 TaxID=1410327 RepID=UPI000644AF43|nr:hypothetical protein SAMD00019534_104230 [Acytostelium subglobosum LB1]GAM27248.1 hypothetical protein SAMD00019534_104230 [Acytostelium subglobosum LB1]|eukprot:XP_012749715.1 hypothetical protein SAMD00019534_104230 [Acytostelium subglobosum LB1]